MDYTQQLDDIYSILLDLKALITYGNTCANFICACFILLLTFVLAKFILGLFYDLILSFINF